MNLRGAASGKADGSKTVELLQRARDGNNQAVRILFDRYGAELRERIRRMMGLKAREIVESMDLLQELFLEVIRDLGNFEVRSEASFLRWASVIARNNIRDRLRRRRESSLEALPDLQPEDPERHLDPSPSTVVSRQEEAEDLRRALSRLPGDYRDVIRLRDFDGLPYREIAEMLGRSTENAVQMLHHRALARLVKELG